MGEVALVALMCGFLAGSATETYHHFDANGKRTRVEVDCETATHVIEVGLDQKSGSRDSIHQALFAAYLTDFEKAPAVIIIDRDGVESRHELEIRKVAELTGVAYGRCTEAFITRWAFTRRMVSVPATENFLPSSETARSICDLEAFATPDAPAVSAVVGVSAPLDTAVE